MDREIEFRGKSLESKRWIYGSYCCYKDYRDIEQNLIYNRNNGNSEWIDKYTVGQYIGLKDKNGTKIFEGDIIKPINGQIGVVRWFNELVWDGWGSLHSGFYCNKWLSLDELNWHLGFNNCEIIGNIYDNPELLEVNND